MGDAWEWELADGAKITARLQLPSRIESVWLGGRLVSRSKAGGKGEPHVVVLPIVLESPPRSPTPPGDPYREAAAPREAEVVFDPVFPRCTLMTGGAVVAPAREPDADALLPPAFIPRRIFGMPFARFAIVAGAAFAILIVAVAPLVFGKLRDRAARAKLVNAPALRERTQTITAPDRSISVHFPADFETTVDPEGAMISLQRPEKMEIIVLVSQPRNDLQDASELDKIMMKSLASFAAKSGATMSTTITHEGECDALPGVISTSTLSTPDKRDDIPQKVVGCSALRDGRSYFFAYLVPELLAEQEEPELLKIINATDIYDLAGRDGRGNVAANDNESYLDDRNNNSPSRRVSLPNNAPRFGAVPNGTANAQRPPLTVTNNRGVTSPPRPPSQPYRPPPPPTPAATLQFNPNGSVEYAGNANEKAAALARDQRARDNRAKVPW